MSEAKRQANADLQARLRALSPEKRRMLLAELAKKSGATGKKQELPHEPRGGRYALSHAQQRLWIISRLGSAAGAAYNISATLVFDGRISEDILNQAFRSILLRHEVLCSHFIEDDDGVIWQEPRDVSTWSMEQHDLGDASDPVAALKALSGEESLRSFDLSNDWLFRVSYCRLGDSNKTAIILSLHHIICDGVSIALLMEELRQHYDAIIEGRPLSEECASHQYRDYVKWLAQEWSSGKYEKARKWWRKRFEHLPEPLPLPLDYPRPSVQSYEGGLVRHVVSRSVLKPFEAYCAKHGCSLFMGLTALTQILLARYCRHTDVVIGTPVAGRIHSDVEDMPGLFVNTVVLRKDVNLWSPFHEHLLAVRDDVLQAFEHQAYPFDRLLEDLQIERDLSRSPLFDVMLGLQEEQAEVVRLGGCRGNMLPHPEGMSKVDLTFHCERLRSGEMELELEYTKALFTRERMQRLSGLWERLMLAVSAEDIDVPVGNLPWLTEKDYDQIVETWNPARHEYPSDCNLTEVFEKQCSRTPDLPALYRAGEEMTYRELDQTSSQLAGWLQQRLDIDQEVPIAFMLEKSPAMIICMLAIVKAGAAYLPLNHDTPADRLQYILDDASAAMLLTDAVGEQRAFSWGGRVVALREARIEAERLACSYTKRRLGSRRLAYIMYTSGSTGEPKGTLIEHRAILRLVLGTDFHQVQEGERVLQTGSPAFDAATFEIWGPLLNGGCCCLPDGHSLLEIGDIDQLLCDCRAETVFLTTGLFNQLADINPKAFRLLRTVLTGGEKVSPKHVNRVLEHAQDLHLLHVYGPTENTTFSSFYPITAPHDVDIPIGRAIANSTLYVLDQFLQPVPVGVPGQIVCGGHGLARGYLGRPDVTASRFVPDPFSNEPGQRLYCTGDIGAWDESGQICFLGRDDHQVKIRGFRIELGEVETHLRRIDGVVDALVIARPAGGTNEMVAYLVTEREDLGESGIRSELRGSLPIYMVPTHIVFLESFPLNASGKVDRRKLPAPQDRSHVASEDVTLPCGELEERLASHWCMILGLRSIDRTANFFSLGGDSIKAIQIVAKARGDGLHFKLADLFQYPSIMALAPHVQQQSALSALGVCQVLSKAPLAPVQQWWIEKTGGVNHFNQTTLLLSRERLDVERLNRCLEQIVDRHPALRLRWVKGCDGGDCCQEITETVSVSVACLDLRGESEEQQQEKQTAALAVAQKSMDLCAGRLVHALLIHRSDRDRLGLIVHHWAIDGVSWRIVLADLENLYAGRPLEDHTVPYPNWCAGLVQVADHTDLRKSLSYWQETAHAFRTCELPILLQEQANVQTRSRVAKQISQEQIASMLGSVNRAWGCDLQELLLSGFVRAWQRVFHTESIRLMMEGHGRGILPPDMPVERTVGWFTALYPFAFEMEDERIDQVCRRLKDAVRRVPDRGVSYGILRYLSPSEEIRDSLICSPSVSFNYLGSFMGAGGEQTIFEHCEENTGPEHAVSCPEPFQLDVVSWQTEDELQCVLQGALPTDVLDALLNAWVAEMRQVANVAVESSPRLSMHDVTLTDVSLSDLDALTAHHGVTKEGIEDILPLTPMQSGMYYQVIVAGDKNAYSDQVCLHFTGDIEESRFRAAWESLCQRHQGLRISIWHEPLDMPVQVVLRDRLPPLTFVDGTAWKHAESELDTIRLRHRENPFNLVDDPLLRLTIVKLDAQTYEWILHFHHIAIDGWSSAVIMRELERLYFQPEALRVSAIGLHAFFQWQQGVSVESDRAYWQETLADYQQSVNVPSYCPTLSDAGDNPGFHHFQISGNTWDKMRQWSEDHQVTLNSIFQALWGVLLTYWSGHGDVVFGATVSGRAIPVDGVEDLVGMLINTLPVRVQMDWRDQLHEVVEHVQATFRASQEHARLGLADIQRLTPAGSRLISHTLVFENYPGEDEAKSEGWQFETAEIYDPMHFSFGVLVAPQSDHLDVRFVVDGNSYSEKRLSEISALFCSLVDHAVEDSSVSVQELLLALDEPATKPWVVSATFTADPLLDGLRVWEAAFGRSASCVSTGFDQVLQALSNPESAAYVPQGCRHIILFRPSDWGKGSYGIEENLDLLVDAVGAYVRAMPHSEVMLVVCPDPERDSQNLDDRLGRRLARLPQVQVFDATQAMQAYNMQDVFLADAETAGGIPYTESFFAVLSAWLYRQSDEMCRSPVKVFAVDADHTLWRGVVGEDGVEGICVDASHRKLGELLLRARDAGKLLCLVTKNNAEDIEDVFTHRSDLPLRYEDFSAVYASWNAKPQSIQQLTQDLNIGADSVVFIDDSPMECAMVRQQCPTVQTIQLPDESCREKFLDHMWLLDVGAVTKEDRVRAEMMATELQRKAVAETATSFASFLSQLAVEVDLHVMQPEEVDRVAQLTQRTNQFHTMTKLLSVAELEQWCARDHHEVLTATVSDRFGAYGITGVLMLVHSGAVLRIENMLLSCRVLGRGVEHMLLRELHRFDCESVEVLLRDSGRNRPARIFLETIPSAEQISHDDGLICFTLPLRELSAIQPKNAPAAHESKHKLAGEESSIDRQNHHDWGAFYEWIALKRNTAEALLDDVQRMRHTGMLTEIPSGSALVSNQERIIGEIWCDLLGVDHVCRESNFFALGGHSLLAVMFIARLQHRYGYHLTLDALQGATCLADMALLIEKQQRSEMPDLVAIPRADHYPLSHAQRRLWMIEQLREDGPSPFHMSACFAFDAEISSDEIEKGVQEIIGRHEVLRTGIVAENGEPRQYVHESVCFRIQVLPEQLTEVGFCQKCADLVLAPFNFCAPPFLRIYMATLDGGGTGICLVMHHIISDGWSMGVLARELATILAGEPVSQLPLQYRDYASWQHKYLSGASGEQDRGFWLQEMSDRPDPLRLPIRPRVRPAVKQSGGADVHYRIPGKVWSGVTMLCRKLQITPYVGLLSAVQILLSRYSGQESLITGTPVAGRPHPDLEPLIGFFVNVVPVKTTIEPSMTLSAYLQRESRHISEILSHQNYPFDVLVDELDLPRDMSRSPLFDVLVVLQNAAMDLPEIGGVQARSLSLPSRTSQYDIVFNAFEEDDALEMVVEYDTALFDTSHIVNVIRHVEVLLQNMCRYPDMQIQNIGMCTEDEVRQIACFESDPGYFVPAVQVMPLLLSRHAKENPSSKALCYGKHVWTYADLYTSMATVAFNILSRVMGGAVVGVLGKPSDQNIVAMLGILRAGCVYLPLDPDSPIERLRFMVSDSGVALLVVSEHQRQLAVEIASETPVLTFGCMQQEPAASELKERLPAMPKPSDVAYLIFTSGSTGKPKAVAVSHSAFSCMIHEQVQLFGVQNDDVVGQFASHSFDASLSEFFLAFHSGACLHIPDVMVKESIDAFLAWLSDARITVLTLPPAFLRGLQHADLNPVRILITAGEAADPEDACYYAQRLRYFNAYGPTETAVCATAYLVQKAQASMPVVPIGRPLRCTKVKLLDGGGQRVPIGVAGELYIGGATIGEGYLHRADLTAARFVTLAEATAEECYYRTGDVCMWQEDGNLVFLRRVDDQCKIRGYRIEPGEIESVMRSCDGVRDAVVVPDARGGLPGWYAADERVAPEVLRQELSLYLPDYMIPVPLLRLDSLPRTVNGKLERAHLPIADQTTYEEPIGEKEIVMAAAWCSVLRQDPVGRQSNFFLLGGDSIKALRVMAYLRDVGWYMTLKGLFAQPNLADTALQLQRIADSDAEPPLTGEVPMLPIQHWFFATHSNSRLSHFNQSIILTCKERIDTMRLQRSLLRLCHAHDSLRATFRNVKDRWSQIVRSPDEYEMSFAVEDWRHLDETEMQKRMLSIDQAVNASFNLEEGPLFKSILIQRPERDALLLVAHHLVVDWVSWRIIIDDLALLYERLEYIPTQMHALSRLGRSISHRKKKDVESLRSKCERALEGWTFSPGTYDDVNVVRGFVSNQDTKRLLKLVRCLDGCGLQDVLLASVIYVLRDLTDLQHIPAMLDLHGRDQFGDVIGAERTTGWFTSLLPILFLPTFSQSDGVKLVQSQTQEGIKNYGDYLAHAGDLQIPALVSFNYLGEFNHESDDRIFALSDEGLRKTIHPSFERDCPLAVSAHIINDSLYLTVAGAGPILDRIALQPFVQSMERYLLHLLHERGLAPQGNSGSLLHVRST